MNIFGKEKDFVLRIMNLILCLWLIGAITYFYVSVVNILMPEPKRSYEEYEIESCYYFKLEETYQEDCEAQYGNYLERMNDDKYQNKKDLFITFGNVVIVLGTLYFLNNSRRERSE